MTGIIVWNIGALFCIAFLMSDIEDAPVILQFKVFVVGMIFWPLALGFFAGQLFDKVKRIEREVNHGISKEPSDSP